MGHSSADLSASPPRVTFPREYDAAIDRLDHPRWIEFLGELLKTATGKIQRFRLRG